MHRTFRDPIFLYLQQLFCCFNHLMNIECGDSQLKVTLVHSSEIAIDSVSHNSSIYCFVSFCTFKTLYAVVKCCIFWHQLERYIWNNHRSLPATILTVIIDFQHVVSSDAAERILVICWWFRFQHISLLNYEVTCHECFFVGGRCRHGNLRKRSNCLASMSRRINHRGD